MTSPQRLLTTFAATLIVLTGMFTASAQTVTNRTRDFGKGRGGAAIKRTGKIAFVRSTPDSSYAYNFSFHQFFHDIYTIDLNGNNETRLTKNAVAPAWSPDGSKIAFIRLTPDGSSDFFRDIYTIDSNGNNETRLTNSGSANNPAWSPDGSKIAFTEKIVASSRTTDTRVSVMNSDGTNPRVVTTGSFYPAWSPDGTRLVVTKFIDGYGDIFVVNLDGTNEINLTNSPRTTELRPAWSPDGKRIVYKSNFLWTMNADGTNPTVLTRGSYDDYPAWSPDSARIVYESGSCFATKSDIYLVNAANGEATPLPTTPPAHPLQYQCSSRPAWSPDGKHIVYTYSGERFAELYIVSVDGIGFRRLTDNDVEDSQAVWQPLVSTPRNRRRIRISPNTP